MFCMNPLRIIVQRYGFKYHLYADETQLYVYIYISQDPDNMLNFFSSLKNTVLLIFGYG